LPFLVVIADIWLVIADLIRNPWIPDQVRDDNSLVRDDNFLVRDDNFLVRDDNFLVRDDNSLVRDDKDKFC